MVEQAEKNNMSRVSISEAAKRFKVSRNTVYKRISEGALTKDAEGLLDVADLVRVFSINNTEQDNRTWLNSSKQQKIEHIEQLEQVKNENMQLKQLLAVNEMLVNQLQQQIQDLKQDKENLFQQLNQRRIESREGNEGKKGLFSKIFG